MKTKYIIILGVLTFTVASVWVSRSSRTLIQAPQSGVVGFNALMTAPESYKGVIQLEGVVTATRPESRLVVLIDPNEWEQCGTDACTLYKLPVHWDGTPPHIHDKVLVQGEITEVSGKFILTAAKLEILPPMKKKNESKDEEGCK